MDLNDFKNRILVIIVIVVVGVLFLLFDSLGIVSSLYNFSALLTVPIRLELRKFSLKVNDLIGVVTQVSVLKSQNQNLREENLELLEEVSKLEEAESENEALKEQLELEEGKREFLLEARVIRTDLAYENILQINVGSGDKVKEGDIVVFGNYAVGEVIQVESEVSKVLLITSRESKIPVRGQKNRASGLISGNVGLTLKMIDILPDEKIQEGEIVVTSGVDSPFPAGLILGKVKSKTENPAYATLEAEVDVQIDLKRLDYVYIIRGQKHI